MIKTITILLVSCLFFTSCTLSSAAKDSAPTAANEANAQAKINKSFCAGCRININVNQTPLAETLNIIARRGNLNLLAFEIPDEKVTLNVRGAKCFELLRAIAVGHNLKLDVKMDPNDCSDTIYIGP